MRSQTAKARELKIRKYGNKYFLKHLAGTHRTEMMAEALIGVSAPGKVTVKINWKVSYACSCVKEKGQG